MMKDATRMALSLLLLGLVLVLVLVPGRALAAAPLSAPPKPAEESDAAKVVEISLTSTPVFFTGKPGFYAPHSALMVGMKRGPWILGVGLDLAFLRIPDQIVDGAVRLRRSFLTTRLSPTLQWAFAELKSRGVDFFLAGRPSIGIGIQNDDEASLGVPKQRQPMSRMFTSMLLGFRAGLGLRIWGHPNLGFSMQTGIEVETKVGSSSNAVPTSAFELDVGAYLSIGLTGAF